MAAPLHSLLKGKFLDIRRIDPNPRLSQAVVHNNILYTAGQVGAPGKSVTEQTEAVLSSIDRLLDSAGSDRSKILQATIWLADMADFDEMNAIWDAWVDGINTPARATGEVKLSSPDYRVEIVVTASA